MGHEGGTAIRDLAPQERPRERMQQSGAQSLSNAELLAILIRTGTRDASAIDLAHRIWLFPMKVFIFWRTAVLKNSVEFLESVRRKRARYCLVLSWEGDWLGRD